MAPRGILAMCGDISGCYNLARGMAVGGASCATGAWPGEARDATKLPTGSRTKNDLAPYVSRANIEKLTL